MKKISICIPCFNEDQNISELYIRLENIAHKLANYKIDYIFVDNGSTDNTEKEIKKIIQKNTNVTGIFLTRNFGAEASGQAAFDHATGDAVIGIAADLQDPPELIPEFIKKWEEGYAIVQGTYTKNEDNYVMRFLRSTFYKIFIKMSNIDISVNVTGFGLIDKKVLIAYRSLPEKYRFGRGLIAWLGFSRIYIPYEKQKRFRGKSSYSIFDYIKASERGVFGFSYLPLDMMVYSGFILVFLSFVFIVWYLFMVLFYGNPVKASIPLMLTIVFFGGVTLLAISILGKYIQVIVEEVKRRPTYIVDELTKSSSKR